MKYFVANCLPLSVGSENAIWFEFNDWKYKKLSLTQSSNLVAIFIRLDPLSTLKRIELKIDINY